MKLGSLFDGSGTAPLAATMCGIEPVWASEIEPYPIKVTTARFPNMKHLGSILDIDGANVESVDIICGGSPCQDLSVAGKQKGLHEGERSHLFFEMTRIIKEMRDATNGKYPRYIIWENVPGAFSSNNGRDFLAVLQAFAEIADPDIYVPEPPCKGKTDRLAWRYAGSIVGDGWSIAWRTVDAQYWGVPQRRRRIYLVADFGSERAGEILFEREGMRGDFAQGREAREEAAADAGRSTEGSSEITLMDAFQHHGYRIGETCNTLTAGQNDSIRGDTPLCVYVLQGNGIDRAETAGCNGAGWRKDECYTLNTIDRHAFAFKPQLASGKSTIGTLMANASTKLWLGNQEAFSGDYHILVPTDRKYIVRRLTPLECCRLQGFPDWWEDGVEGSDSARYKMWGNGMALPNMLHVMKGIAMAEQWAGDARGAMV